MMFIDKQQALFNLFKQVKLLQSLRVRLALWNVLILISTLFILGAIVYTVVGFYLEASLDKRLQTQGEKLQVATYIWLLTGHPVDSELFNQLAQSMPSDEYTTDKLYIRFFDVETGKLLQFSPNLQQIYIQYEWQDFKATLRGEGQPETYYDKNGEAVRILTMPLLDNVNTRPADDCSGSDWPFPCWSASGTGHPSYRIFLTAIIVQHRQNRGVHLEPELVSR
jgi:hypothetical protein